MDQGQSNGDAHWREDNICVLCTSVELFVEIKAKLCNWSRNGVHHEAAAEWEHKRIKQFSAAGLARPPCEESVCPEIVPQLIVEHNRRFLNPESFNQPCTDQSMVHSRSKTTEGLQKGPMLTTYVHAS